jgi:hypothetical protein
LVKIYGCVHLLPPYHMQLTAQNYLVLRLRMFESVPLLPQYDMQLTAQQYLC